MKGQRLYGLASALLLGACASVAPEPVLQVRDVKLPVPVSCVPPELGEPPDYPDTDQALRAAPGAAERYLLVAAGRLLRQARLADLETVVEACRDR